MLNHEEGQGFQRILTLELQPSNRTDFQISLPSNPEIRARYLSCAQSQAGAWLLAYPKANCSKLENEEFLIAFYLRLGIQPPNIDPTDLCSCCNSGAQIETNCLHFFECKSGGHRQAVHDSVVKEIEKSFKHANINLLPISHPFPRASKDIKPDIRLSSPFFQPYYYLKFENINWNINFDVRITNPCLRSKVTKGSDKKQGRAAEISAYEKDSKYQDIAREHREAFRPLVFETYGYWDKNVRETIDVTCSKISNNQAIYKSILKNYWTRRISTALVRATSQLIIGKATSYAVDKNQPEDFEDLPNILCHGGIVE